MHRRTFLSLAAASTLAPGQLLEGSGQKEAASSTTNSLGTIPLGRARFATARPIWPEGQEREKNLVVGFRCMFMVDSISTGVLRITASTVYRAFLNNRFLGYGPARAAHGFYRVDEWPLADHLVTGSNLLAIEVAGYNVNSYYWLDQPSFLQAEVECGGKILASTTEDSKTMEVAILRERVRKVQRYSFQRPFSEVYRLQPDCNRWRQEASASFSSTKCQAMAQKALLPRGVAYPVFSTRPAVWDVCRGQMEKDASVAELWKDRSLTAIGPALGGFREDELEVIPSIDLQKIKSVRIEKIDRPFPADGTTNLEANSFRIIDFGTNLTGFLRAKVTCSQAVQLYFTFDEVLQRGDIDFKRLNCVNVVSYFLAPGSYEIETFEPYTLRYLKLIALGGDCAVEQLQLREYANPEAYAASFSSSDPSLSQVFEAARETFRQNAVDVFTDCPSRERAGWLCDSFWTARAAVDLCGNTRVEKCHLESFLLPQQFAHQPDGMLPMCYPSDHNDGNFIPNWALWFVVQLEEYLTRSGDRAMIDSFLPKVLGLFEYFKGFVNEDGLLEKLKGWVFVEWSAANDFVQDVNYPSNMLYAAALAAASRLYALPSLGEVAEQIRQAVRRQSYDGQFFVDNAIRKDGKLVVTRNRTEVCQYFAFYFGVASPESHPALWKILRDQFGLQRKVTSAYPEIHSANAFIGNFLRFELLSRYQQTAQLLKESRQYYLSMAEKTGTLWEHDDERASCNHGFASHVAHLFYRDVLGVYSLDRRNKEIVLRFGSLPLDWCEGRIPLGAGFCFLKWWQKGDQRHFRFEFPAGFSVRVEAQPGMEIIQLP